MILVGLMVSRYTKNWLFPLNPQIVSCPTCTKNLDWYLTRLEAIEAIEKGSIEAAEAPVLAVVTLTSGDAVKLEDAEVVCLWTRKQQILG